MKREESLKAARQATKDAVEKARRELQTLQEQLRQLDSAAWNPDKECNWATAGTAAHLAVRLGELARPEDH